MKPDYSNINEIDPEEILGLICPAHRGNLEGFMEACRAMVPEGEKAKEMVRPMMLMSYLMGLIQSDDHACEHTARLRAKLFGEDKASTNEHVH